MAWKYFLHFAGFCIISLTADSWSTDVFNFNELQFIYFPFNKLVLCVSYLKIFAQPKITKNYSLVFFLPFIIFALKFRPVINFELIFTHVVSLRSVIILLYISIQLCHHHSLKQASLSLLNCLGTLLKINGP